MEYNYGNEIQEMQTVEATNAKVVTEPAQTRAQPPEIRAGTAMANVKRPLMETRNRFDYLYGYLGQWKESLRYRLAVIALSIFSIWAFFAFPYVLPLSVGLALYYYNRREQINTIILASKRKVIEAG